MPYRQDTACNVFAIGWPALAAVHALGKSYREKYSLPSLKLPFNARRGFYISFLAKEAANKPLPKEFTQVRQAQPGSASCNCLHNHVPFCAWLCVQSEVEHSHPAVICVAGLQSGEEHTLHDPRADIGNGKGLSCMGRSEACGWDVDDSMPACINLK